MRVLCIGDIVGKAGRSLMNELLPGIQEEHKIDFTIANVENAAGGAGVTPRIATQMFRFGCDCLTLGDHTWDRQELGPYLDTDNNIVRPANFPNGAPGKGWRVIEVSDGLKVGVINLLGRVFMRYNVDCPFKSLKSIVEEVRKETNIIFVDFHGETTSEKVAIGHFIDGQITGLVGTHTHIQTADEKILPKGTAYITDLGMTGPYDSVIGQNKEKIIHRFLTSMPQRFEVAKDDPRLHGVIIDVDQKTGLATGITRLQKALA